MENVIHQRTRLAIPAERAFEYFTMKELLESFFTVKAEVEPRVGGKYELNWDPEGPPVQSTIACKITVMEKGRLLAFEWKGPPPHSEVMNEADPLTHVTAAFFPLKVGGSEVHIVHSGWRSGEAWHAARAYFERAWELVLNALAEEVGAAESEPQAAG